MKCSKCDQAHERPVGKKCKFLQESSVTVADTPISSVSPDDAQQTDPMSIILQKLESMEKYQVELQQKVLRLEENQRVSETLFASPRSQSSPKAPAKEFAADGVVPSLQFLRSTTELQKEVASRLKDLEAANVYTGNIASHVKNVSKSGRFRNNEAHSVKYVPWPHEFIYVGAARKHVAYDQLTVPQFTLGFLKILHRETSTEVKDAMLNYLMNLLQDVIDMPWEVSRGIHAVVLQEMEKGAISWTDHSEIERIRRLYAHGQIVGQNPAFTNNTKATESSHMDKKKIVCSYFNSGKCSRSGDHNTETVIYRHICSYCYTDIKRAFHHAESDCLRKKKATE